MKRVMMLMLVIAMISSLAACGKKDPDTPATTPEPTKEAQVTKEAEKPTEEITEAPTAEPTAEPTKEPTAEPTDEPTAEPTEEPTNEPDEFDEFESTGHSYNGLWVDDTYRCLLNIQAEGAADIIFAYFDKTDKETFGNWHEYWTNFIDSENAFLCDHEYFIYVEGTEWKRDDIDRANRFVVQGDKIFWENENLTFTKLNEEMSEQDAIFRYLPGMPLDEDNNQGSGVAFGADKTQKTDISVADVAGTTFCAVCYEDKTTNSSHYYTYNDDVVSFENMDEFDAAFLILGSSGDEGQLCFLDEGMNADSKWEIENGQIKINYLNEATYYGDFYYSESEQKLYVCVHIKNYDVWMR